MEYHLIKSLVIAVILGFAIGMQRTMAHLYKQEGKPQTWDFSPVSWRLWPLLS